MDFEKLERIVRMIENSSMMSFSYKEGDLEISMDKKCNAPVMASGTVPIIPQAPSAPAADKPEVQKEDELFITSPIVGTFYSAAGPDIPAFVKVGDRIKNGDTVCILEAMKLMNEIQCEWDCEIEAVLVSNEQKVEYGQPLFRVKRL